MTRQTVPDPEECPGFQLLEQDRPRPDATDGTTLWICDRSHWEEAVDTPCSLWSGGGVFDLSAKLQALVVGYDETQPKVGYSVELVELVGELLGNYRRTVDTSLLLSTARDAYREWKETTDEGKRYVDIWDDTLQREANNQIKCDADAAIARGQSGPRAKEYIDMAYGGLS